MANNANVPAPIQSTAGAVIVINDKGETSMQKVKVHRYVSGKRPEYAPDSSSGEEDEEQFPFRRRRRAATPDLVDEDNLDVDDPRLRRLKRREVTSNTEERLERHRHIHAPEVIATGDDDVTERPTRVHRGEEEESSSEDEELDEDELEERRAYLRLKAQEKLGKDEELMDVEDEGRSEVEESEQESEYEEYTDSEEETGPRLKPVFVRKRDRITVQEKEKEETKAKEWENETKTFVEERRKQTLKIVEDEAKKELMDKRAAAVDRSEIIDSGDENDETEYENWKLRELKRIKRDRDERELREKERLDSERLHSMTEEERRAEQRLNPRLVTNKAAKGKYKFLQKYFHRGAFYMNEEDGVYRRDFAQPTLEDHFDKTILPKVMQVKNFGRSGRTKYTHLVDQDTTQFDSPWVQETAQNMKFHSNQSAGMKQTFDRPTTSKRKK